MDVIFLATKSKYKIESENMSSTTIFAVIVAVSNAIVAIFSYIIALHNTKHDKQKLKE